MLLENLNYCGFIFSQKLEFEDHQFWEHLSASSKLWKK